MIDKVWTKPSLRWRDGVRRACAEREMGLEESRGGVHGSGCVEQCD